MQVLLSPFRTRPLLLVYREYIHIYMKLITLAFMDGECSSLSASASFNSAVRPVRSDHAEIPKNSVLLDCPMLGIVSGMWWGRVHE